MEGHEYGSGYITGYDRYGFAIFNKAANVDSERHHHYTAYVSATKPMQFHRLCLYIATYDRTCS